MCPGLSSYFVSIKKARRKRIKTGHYANCKYLTYTKYVIFLKYLSLIFLRPNAMLCKEYASNKML